MVYSLTPPASPGESWNEAALYSFAGNGTSGAEPSGPLVVAASGVLYGSTTGNVNYSGGNGFDGTVYSLTPPATAGQSWKRKALYSFGWADGPAYLMMGSGGVLYGGTAEGGANLSGLVFSLARPSSPTGAGWNETVLYNLPISGTNFNKAMTIDKNGVVYSTSNETGSNGGSVFSLTPPATQGGAWTATTLCNFPNQSDGMDPNSLVLGSGGILYGTTSARRWRPVRSCGPAPEDRLSAESVAGRSSSLCAARRLRP